MARHCPRTAATVSLDVASDPGRLTVRKTGLRADAVRARVSRSRDVPARRAARGEPGRPAAWEWVVKMSSHGVTPRGTTPHVPCRAWCAACPGPGWAPGGGDVSDGERLVRVLLVDDQELVRWACAAPCGAGTGCWSGVRRRRPGRRRGARATDRTSWSWTCGCAGSTARRDPGPAPAAGGPTGPRAHDLRRRRAAGGRTRAGASGFLLKDSPAEHVVRGVLAVAVRVGRCWIRRHGAGARHLPQRAPEAAPVTDTLSPTVSWRCSSRWAGLSNGEIASTLVISEVTVKSYIGRIFTKLDLGPGGRDRLRLRPRPGAPGRQG